MLEADHAYAVEFALAQCESMDDAFAIKDARIAELEARLASFADIEKRERILAERVIELEAKNVADLKELADYWKSRHADMRALAERVVRTHTEHIAKLSDEITNLKDLLREARNGAVLIRTDDARN